MAKKVSKGRKPAHTGKAHHGPRARKDSAKPSRRSSFSLGTLQPPAGSRKRKVRVGRGIGSKLGKTAGAGNKGQKSRRGYSRRRGFEGGQMPLHRRIPKRGFHNPFGKTFAVLNVDALNVFPAGETVTPELLRSHGFIRGAKDRIKILGDGELTAKLTIHAHAFSASAKEKITQAGGAFEVVA